VKAFGFWRRILAPAALAFAVSNFTMPANATPAHNIILFIPDGLRSGIVTTESAPTFARLRDQGVNFVNSHSLFPTFTTANASAFATGHTLGDTGDFSNTIATGFPVTAAGGSVTPFLESDPVLAEVNGHFSGNYLDEESILAGARAKGYLTAAIGKLGPVAIQDLTAMGGSATLIVDDTTGQAGAVAIAADWSAALDAAGIPKQAPPRGANSDAGDSKRPGTLVANVEQQRYFVDVATRVVLPRAAAEHRPFVMVFWSRDPDGSQHNQGDSLDKLTPGINGPTSLAAIRNADNNLAAILAKLRELGLDATTDVIVAADHGFSTISKASSTSGAAKQTYSDVVAGELPPGFLAIDLAAAVRRADPSITLSDPDAGNAPVDWSAGQHPSKGNALIGTSATAPQVIVAANGGSDLIYLPSPAAKKLAPRLVRELLSQDYVSGLFVDRRLGSLPGTLPLSAIGLEGEALTPRPSIIVNFRSFATGCSQPLLCAAEVADTKLQQGQGMHGSFSRADTWNFMAAVGPDFKAAYVDHMPASNADIGMTLAHILGLDIVPKGKLVGRVLEEGFVNGKAAAVTRRTIRSQRSPNGLRTILTTQSVGSTTYFDAAGFKGRTLGLKP
jgi:hypothetical protein